MHVLNADLRKPRVDLILELSMYLATVLSRPLLITIERHVFSLIDR